MVLATGVAGFLTVPGGADGWRYPGGVCASWCEGLTFWSSRFAGVGVKRLWMSCSVFFVDEDFKASAARGISRYSASIQRFSDCWMNDVVASRCRGEVVASIVLFI